MTGDTSVATDQYNEPAGCGIMPGAPDQVLQIEPSASGLLTVMIGRDSNGSFTDLGITAHDDCQPPNFNQSTCWLHSIYLRSGASCAASTTIAPPGCNPAMSPAISQCGYQCPSGPTGNGVSIITAPVTAGTPVWLFVDGVDATTSGPYLLQIHLQ